VGGNRFFVITGASGAGKSTLLAALREKGFSTVPEVGRAIVQKQVASGGTVLPWIDQPLFMEEVLRRNVQDHRAASQLRSPVFFDRGVPECLAWARILGVGVQPHHRAAVAEYRYDPMVFLAEPWPEIYVTDSERRGSYTEATASYQPTVAAYIEAGYLPVTLPKGTVAERVAFVLARVKTAA
jgi:predicted ATPase